MKNFSRKAFTLIELILVVAVIVILSGALMISSDESIASAEADNIIMNLRILKTAALEWLIDYGIYVDPNNYEITYPFSYINIKGNTVKTIQGLMKDSQSGARATMMKYINMTGPFTLSDSGGLPRAGEYAIMSNEKLKNKWFAVYKFKEENNNQIKKIKRKISKRAQESGLFKSENENKNEKNFFTADANFVYLEIIDLAKK